MEKTVPVFTVIKNDSILKNIFLLENPPSTSYSSSRQESAMQEPEIEFTLTVGRHPDCDIILEHPSISRSHVRIHFKPPSRCLFVTDLFSGHGTWISNKRIHPGVRVKLNEGDILQLGASSRLYRLHWIPLNQAYDVENSFVPKLNASDTLEATEGQPYKDENGSCCRNDPMQALDDRLEGLELLFSDENLMSSVEKMSPLMSPVPEGTKHSCLVKEEVENEHLSGIDCEKSEKSFIEISVQRSGASIWSRRGKLDNVWLQTDKKGENIVWINNEKEVKSLICEISKTESVSNNSFAESETDGEQIFNPDKENCSPSSLLFRPFRNTSPEILKNVSGTSFPVMNKDMEEIFTPDKENITPGGLPVRYVNKIEKSELEEVKHPESYRPYPVKKAVICNTSQDAEVLPSLDRENQAPKVLQEQKSVNSASKSLARLKRKPILLKARVNNREPFQPLFVNSSTASLKSSTREDRKRWTIIVDAACLLNKKSRKELQLLRGLKGTTLVIPRTVVRELDCMLKRGNFFRMTTDVFAALKWIEDCTANEKWWIHLQNSAEEGRSIAPNPRASPFGEDKATLSPGSISFSPYCIESTITPTADDHILECALLFKQMKNNGQLILLTDNDTLKIKAMAEGILCETAENFCSCLVNPFSERFLYPESSPRGQTWACLDDIVLKEKYYPSPLQKLLKSGCVKGLKLILLW